MAISLLNGLYGLYGAKYGSVTCDLTQAVTDEWRANHRTGYEGRYPEPALHRSPLSGHSINKAVASKCEQLCRLVIFTLMTLAV